MTGALLETKLFVPQARQAVVRRPRLTDRLERAGAALVLVSAPAGFGKTSLLAEWLATRPSGGTDVAWVSLDERDDDPTTFWTYVVTALRRVAPDVGTTALELLSAPAAPAIETVLVTLVNDLGGLGREVVLVLDDYHLVDRREIHEAMAFLVERRPAQLRVVLAGRADPPLPLARLRARGELVEVRAADLRFDAEEAVRYLNDLMGLGIGEQDVLTLEERTEGWIAALKLAALSLQGRGDPAAFIADFAGDDRYVVDYLVEEVLQRESPEVQDFLLRTAILDRLCGALCDAVTTGSGGRTTLEVLDRANLFLVPLDDRREWYRYHHLFADALRARLRHEQPALVAELHRRASRWYADAGDPAAAIRHALAAGDVAGAADLVERHALAMTSRREERTLREWLEALPPELVRERPALQLAMIRVLMYLEEPAGVAERLDELERRLPAGTEPADVPDAPGAPDVVLQEHRRLPASIALYRAALALMHDDVPAVREHATRSIALAPEGDHLVPASARAVIGLTWLAAGDLEAAHDAYLECMAGLRRAGFVADVLGCSLTVADIRLTQGRLGDALRAYEDALALAALQPHAVRGCADMHVGISQVLRERGDLVGARDRLEGSRRLGDALGMPQNPYRWHLAMARLQQSEGDPDAALASLDEAERLFVPDFQPVARPIGAWRARVWAAAGRVPQALEWAARQGPRAGSEIGYLTEFEQVTLARVMLADHRRSGAPERLQDARRLLGAIATAARDGGRFGTLVEVQVLRSLVEHAAGHGEAASTALGEALALGAPESFTRVLLDEGEPMLALLGSAAGLDDHAAEVRRLLGSAHTPGPAVPRSLVDQLTERELAVLRMLGTELDGPEIARHLVVSLNTVRTHTRNIYAKLGVSNRRAAVRRATELDLLRRG